VDNLDANLGIYFEFYFIIAKVGNLNTNLEGLFLIMFHNKDDNRADSDRVEC